VPLNPKGETPCRSSLNGRSGTPCSASLPKENQTSSHQVGGGNLSGQHLNQFRETEGAPNVFINLHLALATRLIVGIMFRETRASYRHSYATFGISYMGGVGLLNPETRSSTSVCRDYTDYAKPTLLVPRKHRA